MNHTPVKAGPKGGHLRRSLVAIGVVAVCIALAACGSSSASSSSGGGGASAPGSSSTGAASTATNLGANFAPANVSGPAFNAADGPKAEGTPQRGGTIYYGGEQEPPCLGSVQWVQTDYLARQFLDSLVSEDYSGKIIPWLAASWKVSNNGLTYTFQIKQGVKFTDGTPLNAQAVAANFAYWYSPKTLNASNAGEFPFYKSGKAIGEYTFQLNLTQGFSPLLQTLAQAYFGIESPTSLKRTPAQICEKPVGTGAWVVQQWNHGQNVVLVRNPNYNSPPANALNKGPAYADKLVWSFITDPTTRYGSLTSGKSDAIYDVPTNEWQAAKSQGYQLLAYFEGGKPITFNLNTAAGPFKDELVRQAFAYGTDRKAAVESAFSGVVPYAGNGAVSPATPDYAASLANAYPYDPAKANALLDQAGWSKKNSAGIRVKDGKELTIRFVYASGAVVTEEGVTALQDIQQQAKAIGFNIVLEPITLSDLFSGTYSAPSKFDAQVQYFTHSSPGEIYTGSTAFNSTFYKPPTLLKAVKEAAASNNPATQEADWGKAQQLFVNNAALVGLWLQPALIAVKSNLKQLWLEPSQGAPVFSDAYLAH
jgi:peptide/nickel transport system substrate-binding protein